MECMCLCRVSGWGSACKQVCMLAGCDVVCLTMLIPGNNLGPEGAKALAPSLAQLKQLTRLWLTRE